MFSRFARDVMTTDIITASPDETLSSLVAKMCEHRISGLPVVANGLLLGIVSKTDLIAHELEHQFNHVYEVDLKVIFNTLDEGSAPTVETVRAGSESGETLVRDIMITDVITAAPQTPLYEIAALMKEKNIHRIVITEGKSIAGIITSMDLLAIISGLNPSGADS